VREAGRVARVGEVREVEGAERERRVLGGELEDREEPGRRAAGLPDAGPPSSSSSRAAPQPSGRHQLSCSVQQRCSLPPQLLGCLPAAAERLRPRRLPASACASAAACMPACSGAASKGRRSSGALHLAAAAVQPRAVEQQRRGRSQHQAGCAAQPDKLEAAVVPSRCRRLARCRVAAWHRV
jgi:hypothetical protein